MTAKIELENYKYDFRKDQHMQGIGQKLFPDTSLIALSNGCHKRKIVSFKYENANKWIRESAQRHIDTYSVTYFTELDKYDDFYNIIVLIERATKRNRYYYTIKIPGSRPLEQNNFIDYITGRHMTEIWLANRSGLFHGVKAPIREKFESYDKFLEVKEYNLEDMKVCKLCGNVYSSMFEENYCQDCISKMTVNSNREWSYVKIERYIELDLEGRYSWRKVL